MSRYERSFSFRHAGGEPDRGQETHTPVPGKQTLTEQIAWGDASQHKPVQRRTGSAAAAEADPAQVQAAAQRGIAGGAQRLPYLDLIQRSFGRHDVTGVQAHLGTEATEASSQMGAVAFATGDHIGFGGTPDLHTAAHEAAHVVQQRAGVHLKGGVGEDGDAYERHADAVADRVVAGQSAESLLDQYAAGGSSPAGREAPVQGKAVVQRAVRAKQAGSDEVKSCNTLKGLFDLFQLDGEGKKAYALQMKTLLFATQIFPAPYKAQFDANGAVKEEIANLVTGVGDLIKGSASQTVVSVAANQGGALADQLFNIIGGSIDANYVKAKCPHYEMLSLGLGGQGATDYLTFIKDKQAKLRGYERAVDESKWDQATRDKNALMKNRIKVLGEQAAELETELKAALTQHQDTGAIVTKLNTFRTDIDLIEKSIDLEFAVDKEEVQTKLEEIQSDETEHNSYADGGTDDGAHLDEEFSNNKACSLYALLALVPGFMGANSPRDLHAILRKSKKLKEYDDDAVVAQIRLAAGLKPTMQGGRRLDDFITKEILEKGNERPSFIADPVGEAHTFAAVWKDAAYRPRDNAANPNTDLMSVSKWKQTQIGTTWVL